MEEYLKDIPSRIREPPSEKTSAASEAPLDFVLLEDRRSDEAVPLFLKEAYSCQKHIHGRNKLGCLMCVLLLELTTPRRDDFSS
jgi:hypothetical protein